MEYTEILLFADSTVMTDAQLVSQAEKVFKEAIQIASNSDGWKLEKEDKVNQVTVEMKKNAEGRKIYLCKVWASCSIVLFLMLIGKLGKRQPGRLSKLLFHIRRRKDNKLDYCKDRPVVYRYP